MNHRAFAILCALGLPARLFGWGEEPHVAITRAAVETLAPWEQELLGEELVPLQDAYCLIPDRVYTDKANAPFATMDERPGEVYLLTLHLPAGQEDTFRTLRHFLGQAVHALQEDRIGDAARYLGTISHLVEDYGSPSHTLPGDNMFMLLEQFLPPPQAMQGNLWHGPVENGLAAVRIPGYRPRLLGTTVEEAAWRLMHRVHEAILNARSTTIPILQALYAEDMPTVRAHQSRAATVDAEVLADALHTAVSLGSGNIDPSEAASLREVRTGTFFPLEAANLHYPQSQFFSSPQWGFPRSGLILPGGTRPMPLKLRLDSGEVEIADGISAGMGKSLTFLLPQGAFARFTVMAGLHPDLGANGRVEFTVSGDDNVLAQVTVAGDEPAHRVDVAVGGVSRLQLGLTSRGIDPKSQHAIWGAPTLRKP